MSGLPQPMMVIAAAPYLALAAAAFTMWRDVRLRPRWEWLSAFAGLFALHLWVPLLAVVPGLARLEGMSGLVVGLAYLSLLEFARTGSTNRSRFPRWVTWLGIAILLALIWAGHGAEHGLVSLLLGVPAGGLALLRLRDCGDGPSRSGCQWRMLLAIALFLIPATSFVEETLLTNLAQQGIVIFPAGMLAVFAAVLLEAWHLRQRSPAGPVEAPNYLINVTSVGLILAAMLMAGMTIARLLADTQRKELRAAAQQLDARIATIISQAHHTAEQMADSMSGSPLVIRRFSESSPEAIAAANNVLDRYVNSFRCDIAYLLDSHGVVVASSNRGRPDSLLGRDLGDRQYFLRALAGERNSSVRLGNITRTRGIYAAAPIRDADGRAIGVATVKNELESIEQQLGNEGRTALVDPDGMIWLAARPQWHFQPMWNRHQPTTAPVSAPVGPLPVDLRDLPDRPLQAGELVSLDAEPCEVNHTRAGPAGWSLLSFTPIRPVFRTQASALLITGFGMLVTLGIASSIRLRAQHASAHQQEQQLSTALKEMERLMSVLSHDLRAPLAAAHNSAEYLLEMPEFHGEAREVLGIIAEQQLRMAEMVSRLLDAIRIRNGVMEWAWENVPVQEVLATAYRTVASLPARCAEVQVELDAQSAPATIRGDAQAITRLITNLATNAVRHTQQGSVRISARAQQVDGTAWLVIEAADSGAGIAPDVLPLLGRPFVLGAKQGGSGGSGLGLAIAAGICAAHGGRLTVRSALGRGTTFTAWLRADLPGPLRDGGEPTIHVEYAAP